jgi:hypothetical protein
MHLNLSPGIDHASTTTTTTTTTTNNNNNSVLNINSPVSQFSSGCHSFFPRLFRSLQLLLFHVPRGFLFILPDIVGELLVLHPLHRVQQALEEMLKIYQHIHIYIYTDRLDR